MNTLHRSKALSALAAILSLAGLGCAPDPRPAEVATVDFDQQAHALAERLLLVDTHIDLPYRLHAAMEDVSQRTPGGHFDLERAREGGLDTAFMSIYIPSEYQSTGGAKALADELIDLVETVAASAPDGFELVDSPDEVRAAAAAGRIGLALGIENGAAIEDQLANLAHFHARGVRYVTLTHGKANLICDSSYDEERPWQGLSPFGREVVSELNRLGIMVDVSHVSDQALLQAVELSRAPVIASHSSARHFTPGFERNVDDAAIRAIAAKGGVVQINFGTFLTADANQSGMAAWKAITAEVEARGGAGDPEIAKAVEAEYWSTREKAGSLLTDVADHIDHVVRLVGVDHVGLGSDFDGVDSVPVGLEDVSRYPALIAELLRRGYSEADIAKICGENLLRVWSEVERVAAENPDEDAA